MKTAIALCVAVVAIVSLFGAPFGDGKPVLDYHYGSPVRILPMTFAHMDHVTVSCVDCHHNYVDDTGNGPCMHCHVTDVTVAPLFEEQFHTLCRGCHEDHAGAGEAGGPPRQCVACHTVDQLP